MKQLSDFIDEITSEFLGIPETLELLRPNSDGAKKLAKSLPVYTEIEELEKQYELLQAAIKLVADNPESVAKIRKSLKDLPQLVDVFDGKFSQAEVALLSNFRFCHKNVVKTLENTQLFDFFDFKETKSLGKAVFGNSVQKKFYLKDDETEELKRIRKILSETISQKRLEEEKLRNEVATKHNLPQAAEKWVVDNSDKKKIESLHNEKMLILEHFTADSAQFALKPTDNIESLGRVIDESLMLEKSIESGVYEVFERALKAEKAIWKRENDELLRLDLALSYADFCQRYTHSIHKMNLKHTHKRHIKNGTHLIISEKLKNANQTFSALSLELQKEGNIVTGSNMGGKTVLLQTIGWMQVIAQLGLFVPAEEFNFSLVEKVVAFSERQEYLGGLSGFGLEVERYKQLTKYANETCLFLIDEPGRTTNGIEGKAIVQSLLDYLISSGSLVFIATHLDGLTHQKAQNLRMAGLDKNKLSKYLKNTKDKDLSLNEGKLQEFMRYRVEVHDGDDSGSDAIQIAELLGLDMKIIDNAKTNLNKDQD